MLEWFRRLFRPVPADAEEAEWVRSERTIEGTIPPAEPTAIMTNRQFERRQREMQQDIPTK